MQDRQLGLAAPRFLLWKVEDVVAEHPAVAQVCVVGSPDEKWGETVTAVDRAQHLVRLDAVVAVRGLGRAVVGHRSAVPPRSTVTK